MHLCNTIRDLGRKMAVVLLMSLPMVGFGQTVIFSNPGTMYTNTDAVTDDTYNVAVGNCSSVSFSLNFSFSLPWIGSGNMESSDECASFGPCNGDPSMPNAGGCNACWDFLWVRYQLDGVTVYEQLIGVAPNLFQNGVISSGPICTNGAANATIIVNTQTWASDESITFSNITVNCWDGSAMVSASPNPICQGGTTTLSAVLGTPADVTNQQWTGPGTISSPSALTTNVSNLPVGVHTFTLTTTDVNVCNKDTDVDVTINPAPTTFPAGPLSACANAMGQATFNLTALNNTVNGGSGQPVNWYTNMAATNAVGTPGAFTTNTTTVYAVVGTMPCVSAPVAVQLNVTPAPAANAAGPLSACANSMGQATFNLTTLNSTVNGGSGQPVNWYTNMAATIPVGTPASFTTGTTTVYTVVGTMPCVSAPQAVQLTVNPIPTATPANLQACGNAMGQATFNLTAVNNTVTGGGPGVVNWWTTAAATTPIPNPNAFVVNTPGGQAFATVTNNGCSSTTPALITITVNPTPTANPAGPLQACDQGGGQATFNLNSLNNTINGGSGTVNWFTNAAATNPIATPNSYTAGSGTVYATVTGPGPCVSSPLPVSIIVTAPPTALPATLSECATMGNTATFNLNDANNAVNGGTGNTVSWFSNIAGTTVIANPSNFTTGTVTVYARVDNGACQSAPVAVQLIVNPLPTANPATFNVCVVSVLPPVAIFDLPGTINTINGGSGNTVNWYTDAAGNNPINDITDVLSLPTTVYATVTNAAGCESPTVAVPVVLTFAPPASPASAQACDNGSGQATFNLTTLNGTVNQGQPNGVMYYTNMAATNPVANPAAFTTASTTVYAVVMGATGCNAAPVAITLTVIPAPTATSASMSACNTGGNQATFNLTNVNGIVNGGGSSAVNWFTNMAATNPIANPAAFVSGPTTVYATVTQNGCTSQPVAITLSVVPEPTATPSSLSVCDNGSGQAAFNLNSLNNTINGGTGNAVNWYTNSTLSNPVGNPAAFVSGNATVYAVVSDGFCNSLPVAIPLSIIPAPTAIPGSLSACDNGSGQATFNLSAATQSINGNTGNAVDFYLNAAATMPINNPGAFTAGSITVYAVVDNGTCTSAPVPVTLTVLAAPVANPASLEQCASSGNQATFNLTTVNNTINGGNGNSVDWYSNAAGTTPIGNPAAFTTASVTVYARTFNGTCTSPPVAVTLIVTPTPVASPASLQTCNTGAGTAVFNLTSVNATVNGGSGNAVTWFTNANGTGPIANPGSFTSGTATVYAVVTNGTCASMPVAVSLTVSPGLTLSLVVAQPISCNSATNGSLDLTVTGGAMPFTYDWNVNALDGIQDPAGLGAGNYSVTVSDANGCQNNASIMLNQPAALSIACAQASPVTMIGGNDGAASVTISGGTAAYTIAWSGAASGSQTQAVAGTASITGLVAGSYSVTVTDANNCTTTCNFNINDPSCNIQVSATAENPTCEGSANGSIELMVTGAFPFDFNWSDDALDGMENPMGVTAGTYSVTVTDNNGCQASTSVTLTDPPALVLSCAQLNPVSMPGGNDGAASITISGGTVPYTLLWAGPVSGNQMVLVAGATTISNLPAGTYTLTATDDNGCSQACSFTIGTTGCSLDVTINSSAISPCFGAVNGTIVLEVFNVTGMVQYDWNVDSLDGNMSPEFLPAGFYSVTVTDEAGCVDSVSVTLTTPPQMVAECLVLGPASGPTIADGSVQLTFGNGTGPYQLEINGPSGRIITSDTAGVIVLNDLLPGSYTFFLTDAIGCPFGNGCGFVICGDMQLTLSGQAESCTGAGNGSASVVVTGGLDPFMYLWSTGEVANDSIENLVSNTYTVTVIDRSGTCAVTDSIALITLPLDLVCSQQTPVSTPMGTDGEASVMVSDGTAPYELMWSGPVGGNQNVAMADTVTIGGLAAGVYSLTLTDANGCTETCSFTIADAACTISVAAVAQNETCAGSLNGAIELTVSNGQLPLTFDWSDNTLDGTEDPMGLSPGMYSVTVTDGAGCFASASATIITQNATPNASVAAGMAICEDDCFDFALTLTGTAPFTVNYTLDAGSGPQALSATFANTTGVINVCPADFSLTSGSIFLTLTGIADANCSSALNATSTLTVNPHSTATISSTLCPGESIVVNGNIYDETRLNGVEVIPGVNPSGCDSIITISLSFFPPATGSLTQSLCAGETLTIGSTTFSETNPSGTALLPNAGANGCDSTVLVSLTFIQPVTTAVSPTLCPGENLVVNGNTYDENTPSGQEIFVSAQGCDSIVNIQLNYHPASVNNLSQVLCDGESLTVNGTVYDQTNPSGTETVVGGSVNGCDSTIVVALQFVSPVVETINQSLCPGEQLLVNGVVYNQANPSGTEVIAGGGVNGCDSTIVVALTFFTAPTTNLTQTLCSGENLLVGATVYDENNPSGTEILQSANGCDSTVVVNLSFLPAVSSVINSTLCSGESLTVNGVIYNQNNPVGTEIIIGGASSGCDSTIMVSLTFSPAITAAISGTTSICAGNSATLSFLLSGGTTFNVTYSNGIGAPVTMNNISNGATITVSPGATATYTILSATATGSTCPVMITGSATVSVSNLAIQAQVTSDFQGFDVSCPDSEDGSARVVPLGGLPPFQYNWSNGQSSAEATGLGAATYVVTLTDAAGCTGSTSVTLTAPAGILTTVSALSPLCYGDRDGSILIEALSGGSGPYAWSLDGNLFQTLPAALPFAIANLEAGAYDLSIRDANGCIASEVATVVAPQELLLELGDDRTIKLGDSTLIRAQVNFDIANLQWTPTLNLSTPDQPDSYANPQESTAYRLTASDANGCSASDVVMIFVNKERSVYVPNVFSPNEDGINDLFTVFGGKDVAEIRTFIIFDRWGNMLYQKGPFQPNDLQYGWDGTFEGQPMNAGVYVFYAEVVFVDGLSEVFKGDVTLMR